MDNSEVLDTVPKSDPVQPDEKPFEDTGSQVIESQNNIYKSAKSANTPVIGENNHADSIAYNSLNHTDADKTYNHTAQADKDYNTTVKTTTVQSTGANMSSTWDSEMKMDAQYTAKDGEDYSWNKLATEMAALDYEQEKSQARYESMQTKQENDKAATTAFNDYFASERSAKQTQDKMGWTGGQKTASDLQVKFLQAESAANMYTADEMQRYGVETKLGIARMYADANQKALALQYYQDAIDQSIKEAEQTGYYIPAEASEMMKQDEVARQILADDTSSYEDKRRAENVLKNTQRYYDEKGFEVGYAYDDNGNVVTEYYGIKTLTKLTYEETVRNNKINEELQREANQINREGVAAAWANVELAQRNLELTKSLQNQINSTKISDDKNKGLAKDVKASSETNYYLDKNGNPVYLKKAGISTMTLDNGNYYVWVTDNNAVSGGEYRMVYNSDKDHATQHATDKHTNNNYRPVN